MEITRNVFIVNLFGVKIQPSSHVVKRDFCVIFKHSQNKELTTRHWHVNTQLDLTVMYMFAILALIFYDLVHL